MPRAGWARRIQRAVEAELRRGVTRHTMRRVLRRLGPVGDLLEQLLDVASSGRRRGQTTDIDTAAIADAIALLERSGFQVRPDGSVEPPPMPPPATRPAPGQRRPRDAGGFPSTEITVDTRLRIRDRTDPRAGDLTPWTETPQSSNVYAFAYDRTAGILYVRYKARSERTPRPHRPGPMYSYGGARSPVPPRIYDRMLLASSKGRFVWDRLRVRGTLWGHQYPYTLVEPEGASTGGDVYVPRKATRGGFRTRAAVFTPRGRHRSRVVVRSTLPERLNPHARRRFR